MWKTRMCITGGWLLRPRGPLSLEAESYRPHHHMDRCTLPLGCRNLAENLMTTTVAKTSPALGILKIGRLHTYLKIATKCLFRSCFFRVPTSGLVKMLLSFS